MQPDFISLDETLAQELKLGGFPKKEFLASQYVVTLETNELNHAAGAFPLFLAKDPKTGTYYLIGLLGYAPGVNLFMDAENRWQAPYMPADFGRMGLQAQQVDGDMVFLLDKNIAPIEEDAPAMLDENKQASPSFQNAQQALMNKLNGFKGTREFVDALTTADVLDDIEVAFHLSSGEVKKVTGLSTISQTKMNALTDEQIVSLFKSYDLARIHQLVLSSHQLNDMIFRTQATHGLTRISINVVK